MTSDHVKRRAVRVCLEPGDSNIREEESPKHPILSGVDQPDEWLY